MIDLLKQKIEDYLFVRRSRSVPHPIKAIIFVKEENRIAKEQVYPLFKYSRDLLDRFGFVFKKAEVSCKNDLPKLNIDVSAYDLVFIHGKVLGLMAEKEQKSYLDKIKKETKVVLLDSTPYTSIEFYHLLPHVDLYIKKQLLRNFDQYMDGSLGGQFYYGDIKAGREVLERNKSKILLGWNYGIAEFFDTLLKKCRDAKNDQSNRLIDINCRMTLFRRKKERPEWYIQHRTKTMDILKALSSKFKIVATDSFLPAMKYTNELKKSKICVSPFGFGEVCWRDFESIICGCLLIKPRMGHLITSPNIYLDNETYVPVKWDQSDLKEKIEYYLNNEKERLEIINRAWETFISYYQHKIFVENFEAILKHVDPVRNR